MTLRIKIIAAFMFALVVASLSGCAFDQHVSGGTNDSEVTQGTIDRWVDGDTIKLKNRTRVRLLLIDTPESVAPQEERNTAAGANASDWVKEEFPAGTKVWLTYDIERTDKYDRTLAYVWDEDPQGRTNDESFVREHMLNARILASGNATVLQVEPNGQAYVGLFKRIEREAK